MEGVVVVVLVVLGWRVAAGVKGAEGGLGGMKERKWKW
jgi:hypothetical protein